MPRGESRQRDRMRIMFKSRPNVDISLNEILDMKIAQYGRVIGELRNPEIGDMRIENRTEFKNGVRHSWFKYVPAEIKKELREMFPETSSVKKKLDNGSQIA